MSRQGGRRGPGVEPTAGRWRDAIVLGDARATLAALEPECVHLAVTSPPYNVGLNYGGYADQLPYDAYRSWLKSVWNELLRVLVPGGRFALNVAPTSIKDFRPIHHDLTGDLQSVGFGLRTEILWYKQTMGRRTAWGSWKSPANPHIVPSWEYVLVFSKGQPRLEGAKNRIDISAEEFQRFSDGFWDIPPETRRRGHPAPFPEELIRRLVKFYSYRENLVLDMFGGTGTVPTVARREGRHFLYVDRSPEYCQQALERVRAVQPPKDCPISAPANVLRGPGAPGEASSRSAGSSKGAPAAGAIAPPARRASRGGGRSAPPDPSSAEAAA